MRHSESIKHFLTFAISANRLLLKVARGRERKREKEREREREREREIRREELVIEREETNLVT